MIQIDSFKIIGISVETTNANGKAMEDLGQLWGRFFAEDIQNRIPNKANPEIYSIYTDYESDFTGKYTTIIGVKVHSLDAIPEGLVGREFGSGNFIPYIAKGEMPHAVGAVWKEIWDQDQELSRKYTYDFEVYGERSQQGKNSEVMIYIAAGN